VQHWRAGLIYEDAVRAAQMSLHVVMIGIRWKQARPTHLPSVPRSRSIPCRLKISPSVRVVVRCSTFL
jgi:hypothetical protein